MANNSWSIMPFFWFDVAIYGLAIVGGLTFWAKSSWKERRDRKRAQAWAVEHGEDSLAWPGWRGLPC